MHDRQLSQAIADELEQLQRRKAALSLELMSLQDAARNRKQGVRGSGAITLDTEASFEKWRARNKKVCWILADEPLDSHMRSDRDYPVLMYKSKRIFGFRLKNKSDGILKISDRM